LNNAAGKFISPTERLSANAFDTVIDRIKGTKTVLRFGKHWIDSKQASSTVLKHQLLMHGSAYVVPSATAKQEFLL
jgi:hypothetical protein